MCEWKNSISIFKEEKKKNEKIMRKEVQELGNRKKERIEIIGEIVYSDYAIRYQISKE